MTYSQGGVEGDTYDVVVKVQNENGITTDSKTVTVEATGADSASWP